MGVTNCGAGEVEVIPVWLFIVLGQFLYDLACVCFVEFFEVVPELVFVFVAGGVGEVRNEFLLGFGVLQVFRLISPICSPYTRILG